MKYYCFFLVLLLSACNNLDFSFEETQITNVQTKSVLDCSKIDSIGVPPEVAFPTKSKRIVELPNGIKVEEFNGSFILDGDMVLTFAQIDVLGSTVQSRGATIDFKNRWADGFVYFSFSPSYTGDKNMVYDAMYELEAVANVIFKERNNGNYIEIINGDGNYSNVGMIGGKQTLSLDLYGSNHGTVLHELGHSLGLIHEHQRPDRDKFINVNIKNAEIQYRQNFDLWANANIISSINLDFNSIMMYGSFAFSRNGLPTMVKKDGSTWSANRESLSRDDFFTIQSLYGMNPGGSITR